MFDEHTVAVRRDERVIDHFPHEISRFFVHKRHSKMTCEITGHRHDSDLDISQIKGQSFEERPCTYIFEGKQNHI